MSSLPADAAEGAPPVAASPARGQMPARWPLLNQLEKSTIGSRAGDGVTTVRREESAGCVLYGPYWHFPAGPYRLGFRCEARRPRFAAQPVLGVEVIVLGRFQLVWRDFTAAELQGGSGSVVFEIPPELSIDAGNESRFEFRFFHLGNADLTIGAVELCQMMPEEGVASDGRNWRLLGRLDKSWIGTRGADGRVAIARGGHSGCVLYGGWPYLRLGKGNYRLTVRCDPASSSRPEGPMPGGPMPGEPMPGEPLPGEPVLGVEILGQSWWRRGGSWQRLVRTPLAGGTPLAWREFAGEETQAGSVSLDFAVPVDMALDSGCDAPFDIRLYRLGKAALTITAVDLSVLDPQEMPLPAARERPLRPGSSRRKKLVLVGNCQCRTLAQAFNHSESLNKKFEAKYHFIPLPANLQEFAIRDLEACDILLVQDIHLWDDSPLRDHVRAGAEVIRFPFARFASPWPFDGWNGPTDREAQNRETPNMTFPFLDGLLARLRKEIPDKAQRFAAYRSLEIPSVINYRRLHELEKRRLLGIDRKYGIRVGEFTLENFQKRQIFHSTVRPNWQVFNLLAQFVMKSIGIERVNPIAQRADAVMREPQVPVHPKVARDLGIKWADEKTRYLIQGREVTWESYIRSYIDHYG